MKLTIISRGDPSVGIWEGRIEVDLGDVEYTDELDYREDIREAAQALGEAVHGEPSYAIFDDECPDCHKVMSRDGGCTACLNPGCPSNGPADPD